MSCQWVTPCINFVLSSYGISCQTFLRQQRDVGVQTMTCTLSLSLSIYIYIPRGWCFRASSGAACRRTCSTRATKTRTAPSTRWPATAASTADYRNAWRRACPKKVRSYTVSTHFGLDPRANVLGRRDHVTGGATLICLARLAGPECLRRGENGCKAAGGEQTTLVWVNSQAASLILSGISFYSLNPAAFLCIALCFIASF